jgi:Ca2+-binding EF-hand superfamily protein
MNRKHIFLGAGLLALASTLALAAVDGDGRGQRMAQRADQAFEGADNNHDGRLSQSEWQSAQLRKATEKFRKMDGNRDGSLSREEMRAARDQRRGRHGGGMREKLRELDANGDRQLSRAELGQRMPRLAQDFERLDANADGKLSREELRAGRERRREETQR